MGRVMGFEPTTPGTTIRCSNRLSYTRRSRLHLVKAGSGVKRTRGGRADSLRPRHGMRPALAALLLLALAGAETLPAPLAADTPARAERAMIAAAHPAADGGRCPDTRSRRRCHRRGDRGPDGPRPCRAAVVRHRRRRVPSLLRRGTGRRGKLRRAGDGAGRRRRAPLPRSRRHRAPLARGRRRRSPRGRAERRADARARAPRARANAVGAALRACHDARRARLPRLAAARGDDRAQPRPGALARRPRLLLPPGRQGRGAPPARRWSTRPTPRPCARSPGTAPTRSTRGGSPPRSSPP